MAPLRFSGRGFRGVTYTRDSRTFTITGETTDGLVTATFDQDGRTRAVRSHQTLCELTLAHLGSTPQQLTTRGQLGASRMVRT